MVQPFFALKFTSLTHIQKILFECQVISQKKTTVKYVWTLCAYILYDQLSGNKVKLLLFIRFALHDLMIFFQNLIVRNPCSGPCPRSFRSPRLRLRLRLLIQPQPRPRPRLVKCFDSGPSSSSGVRYFPDPGPGPGMGENLPLGRLLFSITLSQASLRLMSVM